MRSRTVKILFVVFGLTLVGAGCAGSGEPDDYTAEVEENFMTACVEANDRGEGEPSIDDPQSYCDCVYTGYKENVPYEQFKAEDDQLRKDVESGLIKGIDDLSADAQEIITGCIEATDADPT